MCLIAVHPGVLSLGSTYPSSYPLKKSIPGVFLLFVEPAKKAKKSMPGVTWDGEHR